MIYVRGAQSAIAQELAKLQPIEAIDRGEQMPDDGELYLFCAGLIRQKRIVNQSEDEIAETLMVNAVSVIRECDRLLFVNPLARICVIGSESAFKWSFDGAYAAAKAALHRYVETKRLVSTDQQLVCVAPTCVVNTGMNRQRNADGVAALEKRRSEHPKKRWLQPIEVARMVHFLLCIDQGYTTNTVIRMNGGEHCR
jgi:NAD(P)-dependent dehydrogenase (short-subunit alcohol dehydrogenase family)